MKDWISKHVEGYLREDNNNNPQFYPFVFVEIKGGIVQDVKCNMTDAVVIVKDFDVKSKDNEYIYSWPETQL